MPLVSFSSGQVINSINVNANFALCVLTDTSRTITVTHTYTSSQTFTGGWSSAAGVTVSSGTTAVQALTATTGDFTGVLTSGATAASSGQLRLPNATSIAWRNAANSANIGLSVDGSDVFVFGSSMSSGTTPATSGQFRLPNNTALAWRNAANNANKSLTLDGSDIFQFNGAVTSSAGLSGTTGTFAGAVSGVTSLGMSGTLTMSAAASKIVPGATSFSLRNTADNADNLIVTDAGAVTIRTNLTFTGTATKIFQGSGGTIDFRLAADGGSALQILDTGAIQISNGRLATATSTTARASLNIPHGTAPSAPANGDMWSTTTTLNFYLNGVTKSITLT